MFQNIFNRLIGKGIKKKPDPVIFVPDMPPQPLPNQSQPQSLSARVESCQDSCGCFVFDYNVMACYYGKQAFDAISHGMQYSRGVCLFHDGDILDSELLFSLFKIANIVKPSTLRSHAVDANGVVDFGPYLAAMWSDHYSNFNILHEHLTSIVLTGYMGYFTMPGKREIQDCIKLFRQELYLPEGIIFKDGVVVKGTAKYEIGIDSRDLALLEALSYGDIEKVRNALGEGADVNCIDPYDRNSTPLHLASNAGKTEIVKLLLKSGGDPNATKFDGNTPLMIAVSRGHIDVVKTLIAGAADIKATDNNGNNALSKAIPNSDIQSILLNAYK